MAPDILPLFVSAVLPLYHWYVNPVPDAVTENVALPPVHLVTDTGCELIATISFTVRTAPDEVAEAHGDNPFTITLYIPASPTVVFESVNTELVAPEMFPPLLKLVVPFLHWYVKPLPVAVTLKLTVEPEHTVWLATG